VFSPLDVTLTPSRAPRAITLLVHLASALAVVTSSLPLWARSLLILLLLFSFLLYWRRLKPRYWRLLIRVDEGHWRLYGRNNQYDICQFKQLVQLPFGLYLDGCDYLGKRHRLWLFADQMNATQWRRLSVIARLGHWVD